jgi:hypothetical protein
MAIAERPVYPTTSARQARGRREYLRSLEGSPVAAPRPARSGTSLTAIQDRFWLFWVAILSFPSLVFGLLYVLYAPGELPKFLDLGLTETLAVSGLFGASTAFAAFIVGMIATLRARITRKTRIALWTLVVLSLACWLYIWISFSAAVQVPPLIPLKL